MEKERTPIDKKKKKVWIYNIFPRLLGKIENWQNHLDRIIWMGFKVLFINPISPSGASHSLYSILNPKAISPEYGSIEQFKEFLNRCHGEGILVWLDLVANHVAIDSPLVNEHPDWFIWEGDHPKNPGCIDNGQWISWKDLAQFNFSNPHLIDYLKSVIEYWLWIGVDGFRADYAYGVPQEIWKELIAHAHSVNPDVQFFGEALGCPPEEVVKVAKSGFDFMASSIFWWDGQQPWWPEQRALFEKESIKLVGFPESHDTQRCASYEEALLKLQRAYEQSEGILIPAGFEFGFRRKLDVVKTIPQWWYEEMPGRWNLSLKIRQLALG
ncbi:alpha-amylase family glycosyl hydrolase [Candidatus Methylacidiphilum infernorum]|uniref:Glycosidase n=1 Tax=Methylacidiphilum infernorum (isolate V4) TaxID=481448 RepID=B3DVM9_METI4|nr:alpha-amylase family glycosyl hydrolase [Candidatus Methylacidiphilum infernorum]ACD83382.1 Glycosidase [Methylacidiphilum infernorum V4]